MQELGQNPFQNDYSFKLKGMKCQGGEFFVEKALTATFWQVLKIQK